MLMIPSLCRRGGSPPDGGGVNRKVALNSGAAVGKTLARAGLIDYAATSKRWA
jgi:hypothetical protein